MKEVVSLSGLHASCLFLLPISLTCQRRRIINILFRNNFLFREAMADKFAEAWDLEDMLPPKEGSLECHEHGHEGLIRRGLGGHEKDGRVGRHVERDGLPERALPPNKGAIVCIVFHPRAVRQRIIVSRLLCPMLRQQETGGTSSNQVRRDCWEF